jgi:hypothetical protein
MKIFQQPVNEKIFKQNNGQGTGYSYENSQIFLTDCSRTNGQMTKIYEKVTGRKHVLLRIRQSNVQN